MVGERPANRQRVRAARWRTRRDTPRMRAARVRARASRDGQRSSRRRGSLQDLAARRAPRRRAPPAPEAPFHLVGGRRRDPARVSYVDPRAEVRSARCPHIVPKAVLETARFVDFVGYAPKADFSRGGARVCCVPPRGAAAQQARGEPRGRRRGEAQGGDRGEAVHPGWRRARRGGDVAPAFAVPPGGGAAERERARFEEFDFSEHNRTRLVGLVNDLANSYVNPVLQTLHFTLELRAEVLMGHTCEREFCLTCELASCRTCGAAADARRGIARVVLGDGAALNFLRTLRQVREAAALGLIEGRDELRNAAGPEQAEARAGVPTVHPGTAAQRRRRFEFFRGEERERRNRKASGASSDCSR